MSGPAGHRPDLLPLITPDVPPIGRRPGFTPVGNSSDGHPRHRRVVLNHRIEPAQVLAGAGWGAGVIVGLEAAGGGVVGATGTAGDRLWNGSLVVALMRFAWSQGWMEHQQRDHSATARSPKDGPAPGPITAAKGWRVVRDARLVGIAQTTARAAPRREV